VEARRRSPAYETIVPAIIVLATVVVAGAVAIWLATG
jgi:hypothetical protein